MTIHPVRLPKYEISIYFGIYGIFLIYGTVHIFLLRNKLNAIAPHSFANGWSLIGRKRDDNNAEWENFEEFLWKNFSWYISHVSLAEICRFLEPKLVPAAHSILGLAFMLATYQTTTTLTILCELLTFYIASCCFWKSIIWILAFIWIAVINSIKNNSKLLNSDTYFEYYELIVSLSWCVLKCLSFGLSKIEQRDDAELRKSFNFINYCGYCLYFPTFTFGPFMIFDRYRVCSRDIVVTVENFVLRAKQLIWNIGRIFGWLLFIDFALHFVYVYYLEQNATIVKTLNPWALYGFGYLMGQFFHCSYVVFYGVGIALAKFDKIDPPDLPKCIGRIHFYSDMWKHFDQGLYEFLFKYIYSSLSTKYGPWYHKLFASITTFIFIFIWHGFYYYVLVWSALNFICLSLEKIFKQFISSTYYTRLIQNRFTAANQKRIYALLGSQIFIPSSISNFYFFAGIEVGNYFIERTYQSGIINYLALSGCCYCIFQSAEFINGGL